MSSSVRGRYGRCAARNTQTSAASAALTSRSERTQTQRVVQAAEAISAGIDGDLLIAERAQLAIDRRSYLGLGCARQLVGPELHASGGVVVADAAHAEAERAQRRLGALDDAQLLDGDLAEVG